MGLRKRQTAHKRTNHTAERKIKPGAVTWKQTAPYPRTPWLTSVLPIVYLAVWLDALLVRIQTSCLIIWSFSICKTSSLFISIRGQLQHLFNCKFETSPVLSWGFLVKKKKKKRFCRRQKYNTWIQKFNTIVYFSDFGLCVVAGTIFWEREPSDQVPRVLRWHQVFVCGGRSPQHRPCAQPLHWVQALLWQRTTENQWNPPKTYLQPDDKSLIPSTSYWG